MEDPRNKHHPGEGRGPVGKVAVTTDRAPLAPSPNWAPASAGEVCRAAVVLLIGGVHSSLFSREGGSPVWVPAFAGKQSSLFDALPPQTINQVTLSSLFLAPAFQLTYFWYILVV